MVRRAAARYYPRMTSGIAVDVSVLIAKIEKLESSRRLANTVADVPRFFTLDEVETVQWLDLREAVDSLDR